MKSINLYLWEHLRNSIILSCLCNDISSTEAPGETVTTPKLRSHRWYANMSISQLSISYLQEASAATQETEQSPRRSKTDRCLGGSWWLKWWHPVTYLPRLVAVTCIGVAPGQQAGKRLFEGSRLGDLLVSLTPKRVPNMSSPARMSKKPQEGMENHCLELMFNSEGKGTVGFLIGSIIISFGSNIIFIPWECITVFLLR